MTKSSKEVSKINAVIDSKYPRRFEKIAACITVFAAAIVVRLLWSGGNFFSDEAFTILVARSSVPEILSFAWNAEPHPPLYYLLSHFWIRVVPESVWWWELLSILWGALGASAAYLLGRRAHSPIVGWIASLLVVFSPFLIYYSKDIRPYSMAATCATLAAWLLLEAIETRTRRAWVGYSIALILLMYAHYYGVLAGLGLSLVAVVTTWRDATARRYCLIASTVAALVFLPWVWAGVNTYQVIQQNQWWIEDLTYDWFIKTIIWVLAGTRTADWIGPLALGATAVVGLWSIGRTVKYRAAVLFAATAAPILGGIILSLGKSVFWARYLIVSLPPFLVLTAAGIEYVMTGFLGRSQILRLVGIHVGLIAVIILWSPQLIGQYQKYTAADFAAAAKYLDRNCSNYGSIIFEHHHVYFPIKVFSPDLDGWVWPLEGDVDGKATVPEIVMMRGHYMIRPSQPPLEEQVCWVRFVGGLEGTAWAMLSGDYAYAGTHTFGRIEIWRAFRIH